MEARPRSTWMSVVGRVPVAVSCSEKLTLSLKNGEKASVVLKGAALGKESDVRAAVTVERCHPDRWKGREGPGRDGGCYPGEDLRALGNQGAGVFYGGRTAG